MSIGWIAFDIWPSEISTDNYSLFFLGKYEYIRIFRAAKSKCFDMNGIMTFFFE